MKYKIILIVSGFLVYSLYAFIQCLYVPFYAKQCSGCENHQELLRKCAKAPRRCFNTFSNCQPLCRERH